MEEGRACDSSSESRGIGKEAVDGLPRVYDEVIGEWSEVLVFYQEAAQKTWPTQTCVQKLNKRTRRLLTDMLGQDHMSTKHGVSFLMQNAI